MILHIYQNLDHLLPKHNNEIQTRNGIKFRNIIKWKRVSYWVWYQSKSRAGVIGFAKQNIFGFIDLGSEIVTTTSVRVVCNHHSPVSFFHLLRHNPLPVIMVKHHKHKPQEDTYPNLFIMFFSEFQNLLNQMCNFLLSDLLNIL